MMNDDTDFIVFFVLFSLALLRFVSFVFLSPHDSRRFASNIQHFWRERIIILQELRRHNMFVLLSELAAYGVG